MGNDNDFDQIIWKMTSLVHHNRDHIIISQGGGGGGGVPVDDHLRDHVPCFS